MTYQPDSPAALRAKDAPALRASYRRLAAHYDTVVDERDEADKRLRIERERAQRMLDRKQVRIRELESELRARDRESVPVEKSDTEIEQAKSKIADLEERLDKLTGVLADTRYELQVSQDETQLSKDMVSRYAAENEVWWTCRESVRQAHNMMATALVQVKDAFGGRYYDDPIIGDRSAGPRP
ncbi:MAG: hypothetical protein LQ337_006920 [Flavoplaca oasis]|nr:MAG: hypothetical protein LQ337_006920 [Flavoplaca oasis]